MSARVYTILDGERRVISVTIPSSDGEPVDLSTPAGEAFDLPVHVLARRRKKRREIDIQGLVGLLARPLISHAFFELAGAMPNQGVTSVFSFGKGFGVILGVLLARAIPSTLVQPA